VHITFIGERAKYPLPLDAIFFTDCGLRVNDTNMKNTI